MKTKITQWKKWEELLVDKRVQQIFGRWMSVDCWGWLEEAIAKNTPGSWLSGRGPDKL